MTRRYLANKYSPLSKLRSLALTLMVDKMFPQGSPMSCCFPTALCFTDEETEGQRMGLFLLYYNCPRWKQKVTAELFGIKGRDYFLKL